jgi:hypothetical protein
MAPGYWRALLRDGVRVGQVNSDAGNAVVGPMTADEARERFPECRRMIDAAEKKAQDAPLSTERCDECEADIPLDEASIVNKHHKDSCSLYPAGENGVMATKTDLQPTATLEIELTRPSGRDPVYLIESSEHPGMLVVIGLGGLPHGAVIGLKAKERARLRQWLDAQEASDEN